MFHSSSHQSCPFKPQTVAFSFALLKLPPATFEDHTSLHEFHDKHHLTFLRRENRPLSLVLVDIPYHRASKSDGNRIWLVEAALESAENAPVFEKRLEVDDCKQC